MRRIVTQKCNWKSPSFRKGGELMLLEIDYEDGRHGYRISAVGIDMMDNFIRRRYPTNIDLFDISEEEAREIFQELLNGPSKILDRKIRVGESIEGHISNLYDGEYQAGETSQVLTSPFLKNNALGGNVQVIDFKNTEKLAKKNRMSHEAFMTDLMAHEEDHKEVNRQGLDLSSTEREIRAIKKGAEAMLQQGYPVRKGFILGSLFNNNISLEDAIVIISSWVEEWSREYSDFSVVDLGEAEFLDGENVIFEFDNYNFILADKQRERYDRDEEMNQEIEREKKARQRSSEWYSAENMSDEDMKRDAMLKGLWDIEDEINDEDNREFDFVESR